MKVFLAAAVAALAILSGCAVMDYGVSYDDDYAYPAYENDYIWDPGLSVFFFNDEHHHRHDMEHGFDPHHDAPHGMHHGGGSHDGRGDGHH